MQKTCHQRRSQLRALQGQALLLVLYIYLDSSPVKKYRAKVKINLVYKNTTQLLACWNRPI